MHQSMVQRKRLGEHLVEAGWLSRSQLEQALIAQQTAGLRLGQLLIQQGLLSHEQLVQALSRQLQVSIAPEARLRQVRPPPALLGMVPSALAHQRLILPIFYSKPDQSLSLVMADPSDLDSLTRIKEANQLQRLRVLLASEHLLKELVREYYGEPPQPEAPVKTGEGVEVLPTAATRAPLLLLEPDDRQAQVLSAWLGLEHYAVVRVKDALALEQSAARVPTVPVVVRQGLTDSAIVDALQSLPPERVLKLPGARAVLEDGAGAASFVECYLKTLDFFFSLLEDDKSAPSQRQIRQVSQLCRALAQRLAFPARQIDSLAIASYFYPLGDFLRRRGVLSQDDERGTPLELTAELLQGFEPPLPFPALLESLASEAAPAELPTPVDVLRAVSTYIEMRDGSHSFARAGHEKALRFLKDHRDSRFHARVVDVLQELCAKEHLLDRLEERQEAGRELLLVDKDKLAVEVLELRFIKEGFRVRSARTGEEALRQIEERKPDLILSEITLPRVDGFELCARLKGDPSTRHIPFFFLSSRSDTFHVTKGLELGAEDFLTKPVNLEILISKIRRVERALEDRQQPSVGIQGNLAELSLFDLLQVMQLGQKSGRISLKREKTSCELVVDRGALVFAQLGEQRGREAFFALCAWEEGAFAVTPIAGGVLERNVSESTDFLLMEGMRRADERRAGVSSGDALKE